MLEDVIVVQSAVSAFNNAALWAPAFLWWGLLAMPLFALVYWCADVLMARLGWDKNNIVDKSAPLVVGLIGGWIVLMGGNYAVLRDGATVLPVVCALILFVCAAFCVARMRGTMLFCNGRRWLRSLMVGVVLLAVMMSDMHTWWGPLLQVGAVVIGWCVGRLVGVKFKSIPVISFLMLMTVVAILMQPEFFRFGQLGNLTVAHLLFVLMFAVAMVATVVVQRVKASGKIKKSVYVKLKWLIRTFGLLSAAFFVLTEALPVFFAVIAVLGVWCGLSVRHQTDVSPALGQQLYAIMLFLFGIITVMPVISVVGVLCWGNGGALGFWRNFKRLL